MTQYAVATNLDTFIPENLFDKPQTIFAKLLELEAEATVSELSDWYAVDRFAREARSVFHHPERKTNVATHMDLCVGRLVQEMKDSCIHSAAIKDAILKMLEEMKILACALPNAPRGMMTIAYFPVQAFD